MNLTITQLRLDAGLTAIAVDVQGVASASDAPLLKKTLSNALRQGYRTVVVNLARLRDIDSRCLEGFVSVARRLHRLGGRFVLLNCPDDQYSLLLTRHWDRCFLIPRRRRQDAESLPKELRPWVSDQIGSVPASMTREQGGRR